MIVLTIIVGSFIYGHYSHLSCGQSHRVGTCLQHVTFFVTVKLHNIVEHFQNMLFSVYSFCYFFCKVFLTLLKDFISLIYMQKAPLLRFRSAVLSSSAFENIYKSPSSKSYSRSLSYLVTTPSTGVISSNMTFCKQTHSLPKTIPMTTFQMHPRTLSLAEMTACVVFLQLSTSQIPGTIDDWIDTVIIALAQLPLLPRLPFGKLKFLEFSLKLPRWLSHKFTFSNPFLYDPFYTNYLKYKAMEQEYHVALMS